jgi:hypothetical protein
MNTRPLLLVTSWALSACSACSGPRPTDAGADAVPSDARDATVRDVARDVRSDVATDTRVAPPWVDGSLVLPIKEYRWPPDTYGSCAGRTAISPSSTFYSAEAHWLTGAVYYSITGSMGRVVPGSNVAEAFENESNVLVGVLAISGTRLVLGAAWSHAFNEAVIIFDQPVRGAVGRTLWQRQRMRSVSSGGFWGMTATPSLIAFLWQDSMESNDWRTRVFVINSDGTGERELTPAGYNQCHTVRASGERVVFDCDGQVFLWTRGDVEPTRVDPTNRAQWHAFIEGDIVVWLDQRDWPTGSRESPDNPEVYMKNLRTGVVQRITRDLAPNPVAQGNVVVEGDWIAWTDMRHASSPNSGLSGDRIAIYGFHIPTQREYALVNVTECRAHTPMLLGGRLYFAGSPPTTGGGPMYDMDLPVIARDE